MEVPSFLLPTNRLSPVSTQSIIIPFFSQFQSSLFSLSSYIGLLYSSPAGNDQKAVNLAILIIIPASKSTSFVLKIT